MVPPTNTKGVHTMAKPAATTNTAPAATVAAPAAAPAPTYTLNATALALAAQGATAANTLQRSAPGMGKAWRATGTAKPNTRAQALAAIAAAHTGPFTVAQAQAALAGLHKAGVLGSGTPRSYCVAFVANGYFAPTATPAKA